MPRRTDSRDRMVATAARLFRTQGYAATGWRQVVAESGAPWGSQAHHFPGGKEQLAADALAASAAEIERGLRAATRGAHPADAVLRWADRAASDLVAGGWAAGCPVATVALETAPVSDVLAAASAAALESWQAVLRRSIAEQGVDEPGAASLAMLVVAGMEGALLLARAARDPGPLHAVATELADVLRRRTIRT